MTNHELDQRRISELEAALSESKAAHGKTLLLLNKAAFETIPALEVKVERLEYQLSIARGDHP